MKIKYLKILVNSLFFLSLPITILPMLVFKNIIPSIKRGENPFSTFHEGWFWESM